MNGRSISWKRLFIIQSTLVLGACGGGGSSDPASCVSSVAGLCAALNPDPKPVIISTLFTTAPSKITLTSGGSADYIIGGGTAPYTATSANTSVVTTTASGSKLTISSIAAGSAQIAIVDSTGKTVTIDVTVLAKGQTGISPSIFPAAITVGDCTTNIPFVFTGGTSPFTVFTSDNFGVPVSTALPFGPDSYFTASVKNPPAPYKATLTVLDSQSRTATSTITVDFPHSCPTNALLQTQPTSGNARVSEVLTFQITGGTPPYQVQSINAPSTIAGSIQPPQENLVATAKINSNGTSFNVTAIRVGENSLTGTALITVTSKDLQQVNLVFTVFPRP